jgi:hypothetical protein
VLALKGPKPALDFGKAGLEGLPRPGNTADLSIRAVDPSVGGKYVTDATLTPKPRLLLNWWSLTVWWNNHLFW